MRYRPIDLRGLVLRVRKFNKCVRLIFFYHITSPELQNCARAFRHGLDREVILHFSVINCFIALLISLYTINTAM